ncbi:hypothetical protein [Evansella tamaricis]|uniref:Uncharacterized protein n=1 Tax=Evansella tamaricis TaxID=2069301 RepID=A0ABS6JL68_9BACI|nr:hypothetical protein [Evansella tamaricis]MBU9714415.1 hypothetical protein [Evansella tamaricis]
MILSVVHTYASNYGWTRDYILDNTFLDESFILQEMIEKEKNQNYLMMANIQMVPHMKEKSREQFLENLMDSTNHHSRKYVHPEQKTDFEGIKRAKQQLKAMSGGV